MPCSREKLRPSDELRKSRIRIFHAKLEIRALFKEIDIATGVVLWIQGLGFRV